MATIVWLRVPSSLSAWGSYTMSGFAFQEAPAVAALRVHGNNSPPGALREYDRMVIDAITGLSDQISAMNESNESAHSRYGQNIAEIVNKIETMENTTSKMLKMVDKTVTSHVDKISHIERVIEGAYKYRASVDKDMHDLLEKLRLLESGIEGRLAEMSGKHEALTSFVQNIADAAPSAIDAARISKVEELVSRLAAAPAAPAAHGHPGPVGIPPHLRAWLRT